jgi:hypothetical protein
VQCSIAAGIALGTITIAVIVAVNFDQQTTSETSEVRNVAADWVLPSELQAIRSRAQHIPKQHLRQGHLSTELTSEKDILI